jgi:hypothetical protein
VAQVFICGDSRRPASQSHPLKGRNLEGRCLQRLEASETPLGAASDSPPLQSPARGGFSAESNVKMRPRQRSERRLELGSIVPRRFGPAVVGSLQCARGRAFLRCRAREPARDPDRRKFDCARFRLCSLRRRPAPGRDAPARPGGRCSVRRTGKSVHLQPALAR